MQVRVNRLWHIGSRFLHREPQTSFQHHFKDKRYDRFAGKHGGGRSVQHRYCPFGIRGSCSDRCRTT